MSTGQNEDRAVPRQGTVATLGKRLKRTICLHFFEGRRATAAIVAGCAFLLVASIDLLSPHYITFGTFYLTVTAYSSWMLGRRAGWATASAAIAASILSGGFGGSVIPAHTRAVAVVWSLAMQLLSSASIIELTRGFRRSFNHARDLGNADALTGLLNRRAFGAAAERALARAHRSGHVGAILYADLDGFKLVNDRLGHLAGDKVLLRTARALQDLVRPSDLVARHGGDEFVLFLDAPDRETAQAVRQRLERQLRDRFASWGHAGLSCSIGAALALPGERLPSMDELIAQADRSMYQAKANRASAPTAAARRRSANDVVPEVCTIEPAFHGQRS